MPIPNVPTLYQKLASGSEGGHEFARIMRLLISSEYGRQKRLFIAESDASGDFRGLDGYLLEEQFENIRDQAITGFQFKFYQSNLSSQQKKVIQESLQKAIRQNPYMEKFILVTPDDFQMAQMQWFHQVKEKYEYKKIIDFGGIYRMMYFTIEHWGHSRITELMLKNEEIGRKYYPDLFPYDKGKFKLLQPTIDTDSKDPVFDFRFANSTPDIHLLSLIEVQIEEVYTGLYGFPKNKLLRSSGTLSFKLDFNKEINRFELPDPIIFKANEPMRFKLRFKDFKEDCPGNTFRLKFWFHFDQFVIPTDSISFVFL
ncbi:MAG: hypothetical protein JST83_08690 [Bacteroidetes bacterium]|nr:hypothetical protein [Bacteroidota bacterium]